MTIKNPRPVWSGIRFMLQWIMQTDVLQNLPQVLALVTEHHGAVVWVVLLDEDVTVEAAHVLDTEDTDRTE